MAKKREKKNPHQLDNPHQFYGQNFMQEHSLNLITATPFIIRWYHYFLKLFFVMNQVLLRKTSDLETIKLSGI